MFRFPKSARLKLTCEFRRVKANGVVFHGRFMVLSVLKTDSPDEARLGLITSRRVGIAVQRNAVRRRLREIFRTHRPQLRRGVWLTVIAKKTSPLATFEDLRREWLRLAGKASIFADSP